MASPKGRAALGWCAAVAIAIALLWFGLRARDMQPGTAQRPASSKPAPVPAAPAPAPEPIGTAPASPAEGAESASAAPAPQAGARPRAKIRVDYESEARDPEAAAAEARIREIYAAPGAEGVLHEVHCTATVCKIDARWSRDMNHAYNAALLVVVKEFSKEVSLEPGGTPEGPVMPMAIYVRRPGHAAESAPSPPNPVAAPAPGPPP